MSGAEVLVSEWAVRRGNVLTPTTEQAALHYASIDPNVEAVHRMVTDWEVVSGQSEARGQDPDSSRTNGPNTSTSHNQET